MITLLTAFTPLLLVPLLSFITYAAYDHVSFGIVGASVPLLMGFVVAAPILHNNYARFRCGAILDPNSVGLLGLHWKLFGSLVVLVSAIEMTYFGFPLFGGSVYAMYGFPFLHHIAVSSWMIVFMRFKRNWVNISMYGFAIANPFLIANRDLLLLTVFALLVKQVFLNRVTGKKIFVYIIAGVAVFVIIGQLRSGNAISLIKLPAIFDVAEYGPLVFWTFIYLTSSTFNAAYNFDTRGVDLYSPYINVFPEYYRWMVEYGLFGYYLFFILLYGSLFILGKIRFRHKTPLMIFLIYQASMAGIFATKFFISHTLFVLIVFLTFNVLSGIRLSPEKDPFEAPPGSP